MVPGKRPKRSMGTAKQPGSRKLWIAVSVEKAINQLKSYAQKLRTRKKNWNNTSVPIATGSF